MGEPLKRSVRRLIVVMNKWPHLQLEITFLSASEGGRDSAPPQIGLAPGKYRPHIVMGQEFYPWRIRYDVKSRGRTVILHDRVRKRILARGAHVSFSVRERSTLDKLAEAFEKAIASCNQL